MSATAERERVARRAGRGRLVLGAQSALATVLAVGAAVLAVDLSDWRYIRVDLSASGQNTLDPAVLDVIDQLPEPVQVDVFFRPLAQPYTGISLQAQGRVLEYLQVVLNSRRNQVEVKFHDPKDFEETQERQSALGIEGYNLVVLSCGSRRAELQLFGELCSIDWGNPSQEDVRYLASQGIAGVVNPRQWDPQNFRPAQFREFRGEELFAQSLLKVASGEAPRVYFAKGHGEPALTGQDGGDLSKLRAALERDGFAVAEWDPEKSPEVPSDCAVLALIGAHQSYQERTRAAVQAYAEGGGHVLAAPDVGELEQNRGGGIVEVLRAFGIVTRPGIVCQPFMGVSGRVEGDPSCSWLVIDEGGLQPSHPLTEPLRRRGRRVQFRYSLSFEAGYQSETGVILPLVTSPRDSWRDFAEHDWRFNPSQGEARDRMILVATKDLHAAKQADAATVRRGRILAVASAFFFANDDFDVNRDFALNAFNWLAEREYRLSVSPLRRSESLVDFERSSAKPILIYTLLLVLPGLCMAIGATVFLRRRT